MEVSSVHGALANGTLVFPPPEPLTPTGQAMPYCLVASEAFPLKHYIMRPYTGPGLSDYCLSRARRTVKMPWAYWLRGGGYFVRRLLQHRIVSLLLLKPQYVFTISYVLMSLAHNYCPAGFADFEDRSDFVPGEWRHDGCGSGLIDITRAGTNTAP